MKIRSMLIIIISCFILVSMIVFSVIVNNGITSAATQQFDQMVTEFSEKQTNELNQYLGSLVTNAGVIANNASITGYMSLADKQDVDPTSEEYIAAKDALDAYSNAGVGVTYINLVKTNGHVAMNTGKEYYTSYTNEEITKYGEGIVTAENLDDGCQLVVCVKNGGGNVVVAYDGLDMIKLFANAKTKSDVMYFLSANEQIIQISESEQTRGIIGSFENGNVEQKLIAAAKGTDNSNEPHYYNDNKNVYTCAKVGATGWSVGIIYKADVAFEYANGATGSLVGCTVALGIILLVLNVAFVLLFTKPLSVIEETLNKIRRGDHDARININSDNEYGEIAKAFNELIDDIIVSESRYRTIIEMSDNIIFEWNFKTNEVFFSGNFNKKFSYRAPSDHFGDSFLLKCKVHPDDADRYRADLEKLSRGEEFKHNEYRWKNIYGDYIWILIRTATIKNKIGEIVKVVGVIVDIDRAKKSESLLTTRASFDSLTGLYNRETVESLINTEIDLISARKAEFAILFVDVDDFKIYNDKYSHATGDQVLKFVANSIQNIIMEFGIAGRYGGDEFVVCIRNTDVNDPSRVAQDILNKLRDGFICDIGELLTINVSIGISIVRDESRRVEEIIGIADDAMYKIKKAGKSAFGYLD